MEISNYLNFNFNLLCKYKTFFLLGKKITLINDIENKIINFLNKTNSLQIFRYDLKLNIKISDIKKNILIQNFFYSKKLFILNAEEQLFYNYSIKKNVFLINKLINNNCYLIVKNYFYKKLYINILKEYKIKEAVIIDCNINNNINDFKKYLILKYKTFKITFSNILYKYLYLIYKLDKLNFYNIMTFFSLNYSNSLITLKNIPNIYILNIKFFNIENFFKNLYDKKIFFIVIYLVKLQMFDKKDKLIYIFEELKNIFLILLIKFFNFKNKYNFTYTKNKKIDIYLHKIIPRLTYKKIYKMIYILHDIEYIFTNLLLDNEKKCKLIFKKIFFITLLFLKN